jgi:hypothetical protein
MDMKRTGWLGCGAMSEYLCVSYIAEMIADAE